MAYQLNREDASIEDGVRRIALEQIDVALRYLATSDEGEQTRTRQIHEVRRTCKKVRALLRLVRTSFADYRVENNAFRDLARRFSRTRDSHVLLATFDTLIETSAGTLARDRFASVRSQLVRHRHDVEKLERVVEELALCGDSLRGAAGRVIHWSLDRDGFDALEGGLRKTYDHTVSALAVVLESRSIDAFHEWRKRCKYHWYHARLLQPIWAGPMQAYVEAAAGLAHSLGMHHDLAVLRRKLTESPLVFGEPLDLAVLTGIAGQRLAVLEAEVLDQGVRLLALKGKALTSAWRVRFEAWRRQTGDVVSQPSLSRHL